MRSYVKLEDVAEERGESPAKIGRTLVRNGCDLYLHFGEARKSRAGVSFYPDHPTLRMEHNIGTGDHPLTKDSQEAGIKRLGRVDTTTVGLMVLVYWNLDATEQVEYQIELMEQDNTVCVVVDSEDLKFLPPLPAYQDGAVTGSPTARKNNFFENSGKKKKESPTELDLLLKNIIHAEEKSGEETSANAIWNIIKKEINRKTRKYDRKNILSEFVSSENLLGKIIWKKGKKLSKTSCTYRTFENKLSKTRKNNH